MIRTLVCGFALLLTGSSLGADELRTLGGKTIIGTLTAISDAELTIKTDAGPIVTPLAQVLDLELRSAKGIPAGTKYTEVRLLDNSMLHCQSVAFSGNDAELILFSGPKIKLPISFVAWMVQDAHNTALRKKFDDVLAQKSKRDRIVILKEMEVNALEGTLGDVDAKGTTIQFQRDGANAVGILLSRLHGLIFYRTEVPAETPICRVYDTDGNTLAATKIGFVDSDQLVLTTGFGAKVVLQRDTVGQARLQHWQADVPVRHGAGQGGRALGHRAYHPLPQGHEPRRRTDRPGKAAREGAFAPRPHGVVLQFGRQVQGFQSPPWRRRPHRWR